MLTALLVCAAFAAGVTGAWSPCGFSMVETLAPDGYAGRLRTTLLACATFTVGALAGGIVTFGGLAVLGEALGAGSAMAAAAVAIAAAAGEVRGLRIVPQVRRQVPESWRRALAVPVAAGLYGVLLGLGFTTFILTFAVWALAGVSLALGDVTLGVAIGLGFAAGRALVVIVLAPATQTEWGSRAHAAMAEQPAIYRGLRAVDAVALALCAVVLVAEPAAAQTSRLATRATDPSATPGAVAWQRPGGAAFLLRAGTSRLTLSGRDPVLSGLEVAWRSGTAIHFAESASLRATGVEEAPGDAFGFSPRWVAWRVREPDGDHLLFSRARGGGPVRLLGVVRAPDQLGRPVVDGDRVILHVAKTSGSRLQEYDLRTGLGRVVRREKRELLLHPSIYGGRLIYVRSTARGQQLRLGLLDGAAADDVTVHATTPTARRDSGVEPGLKPHDHFRRCGRRKWCAFAAPPLPPRPRRGVTATLWSTALDGATAYFTRVVTRKGVTTSSVYRLPLPASPAPLP